MPIPLSILLIYFNLNLIDEIFQFTPATANLFSGSVSLSQRLLTFYSLHPTLYLPLHTFFPVLCTRVPCSTPQSEAIRGSKKKKQNKKKKERKKTQSERRKASWESSSEIAACSLLLFPSSFRLLLFSFPILFSSIISSHHIFSSTRSSALSLFFSSSLYIFSHSHLHRACILFYEI